MADLAEHRGAEQSDHAEPQVLEPAEPQVDGGGCFDGAILEVSTNGGGSWTQVPTGSLLTDPYDGTITGGFGNPLGGDQGWCGDPQAYLNSIVDIPSYAGETVQFRFKLGHDSLTHRSNPNWAIDDVQVTGCSQ